jgi:hypothetical protein
MDEISASPVPLRPLNKVTELAAACGLEVTYAYDDLVFLAHSEVLIQFPKTANAPLMLHVHNQVRSKDADKIVSEFTHAASEMQLALAIGTTFSMREMAETQEMQVVFDAEI